MRAPLAVKKPIPFPFVLEELAPCRPTIKRVFGLSLYLLDDKLLCALREAPSRLPN
jgi:hypothetical protein